MAKDIHSTHNFVGGAKISGLPQAVNAGEPVVLEQMNAALEGLAFKDDVVAASTANINLSSPGATIDGVTMNNGDRFLAKDQTTASQNGIYIWTGASSAATRAADMSASAEFNAAIVPVKPGGTANGGTSWRCTTADPTVGTTSIAFTPFNSGAGAATETASGVAEIATQAETDTGTDDARFITPLKLTNWSGRKRKASGTIGDGSATSFPITHNFGTRDVTVEVYRNSSPWDTVICDVERTSTNQVTIKTASAISLNQLAYIIIG